MKPTRIKNTKSKSLKIFGLRFEIWKVIQGYHKDKFIQELEDNMNNNPQLWISLPFKAFQKFKESLNKIKTDEKL